MADAFYGEIRALPYSFAPRDWAKCEGQLLPLMQNQVLYSILGTTFGGDARTTVGLPDLRGRTPMHPGSGQGLTPRMLGEETGSNSVVLREFEIPSHTHAANASIREKPELDTPTSTSLPHQLYSRSGDHVDKIYSDETEALAPMSPNAISTVGQYSEHENRQPFICLNFCICLSGVYPSRS